MRQHCRRAHGLTREDAGMWPELSASERDHLRMWREALLVLSYAFASEFITRDQEVVA